MDYPEFPDSVCRFLRNQAECDDSKAPVVIEDGQHEPTLRGVYKNKRHLGTVRLSVGWGYVIDKRSLLTERVGRFYDNWIKRSRRLLASPHILRDSGLRVWTRSIVGHAEAHQHLLEGWIDFLPNEPMFVYLRDSVLEIHAQALLLTAAQGRS